MTNVIDQVSIRGSRFARTMYCAEKPRGILQLREDFNPGKIGSRAFEYMQRFGVINVGRNTIDLGVLKDVMRIPMLVDELRATKDGLSLREGEEFIFKNVALSMARIAKVEMLPVYGVQQETVIGAIRNLMDNDLSSWNGRIQNLRKGTIIDLTGSDFRGRNFVVKEGRSGIDEEEGYAFDTCQGTCFADTILDKALFEAADLRNVNLRGTRLYMTDFKGANLSGAHLDGAMARRAIFAGALLNRFTADRADLLEASFDRANIEYASFIAATGLNWWDLEKAANKLIRVIIPNGGEMSRFIGTGG